MINRELVITDNNSRQYFFNLTQFNVKVENMEGEEVNVTVENDNIREIFKMVKVSDYILIVNSIFNCKNISAIQVTKEV
jgi:hypothetical protein